MCLRHLICTPQSDKRPVHQRLMNILCVQRLMNVLVCTGSDERRQPAVAAGSDAAADTLCQTASRETSEYSRPGRRQSARRDARRYTGPCIV